MKDELSRNINDRVCWVETEDIKLFNRDKNSKSQSKRY